MCKYNLRCTLIADGILKVHRPGHTCGRGLEEVRMCDFDQQVSKDLLRARGAVSYNTVLATELGF